jgi:hypothetical protein
MNHLEFLRRCSRVGGLASLFARPELRSQWCLSAAARSFSRPGVPATRCFHRTRLVNSNLQMDTPIREDYESRAHARLRR